MLDRFLAFFMSFFGGQQTAESLGYPKVAFYREAAYHGQHGSIIVDNRRLGLRDVPIGFVFIGMTKPPHLNQFTMNYIWEQALSQGYIPKHIEAYGFDAEAAMYEKAADFLETKAKVGLPKLTSDEVIPGVRTVGAGPMADRVFSERRA